MSDSPSTTLEMTTDSNQETATPNDVPPDIPSQHICKNLLLIDSRIKAYDEIIASINSDTTYIVFDYEVDTIDVLKTKIAALAMDVIIAVGIVQHNYMCPGYRLLDSMQNAILRDIETMDASLNSWSDLKDFCLFLKNEKGTQFYDLLACNIYSDPNWVYVLDQLETACGMDFRASSDETGWGGNWILESDNIDLTAIYFTPLILQWQYTLGLYVYENGTQNVDQSFCSVASNWPVWLYKKTTINIIQNITLSSNINKYFHVLGDDVTINGGGFTITIGQPNGFNWYGLVKNGSNGVSGMKNLKINNINLATTATTGCLYYNCGYLTWDYFCIRIDECNVSNCSNSGNINVTYGGGLFGQFTGAYVLDNVPGSVKAYYCYNTGKINVGLDQVGGIFGQYSGAYGGNVTAINCYNTGDILSNNSGGIFAGHAGSNNANSYANATNCYNTGNILSINSGGIYGTVAANNGGNATATNCYNIGQIGDQYNYSQSGGIYGYAAGQSSGKAFAINCYNAGNIVGANCGGIYGYYVANSGNATATNCSNSGSIGGTNSAAFFAPRGPSGTTTMTNCKTYFNGILGTVTTNTNSGPAASNEQNSTGGWSSFAAKYALTNTTTGTSTVWIDLPNGTTNNLMNYFLVNTNCLALLIARFGSEAQIPKTFIGTPTITAISGGSGSYTITFNTPTNISTDKNYISNYKYATSNDNVNWSTYTLFSPTLTSTSTTATINTTQRFVSIRAFNIVDGPVSLYTTTNITRDNLIYNVTNNTLASVVGFNDVILSVPIPSSVVIANGTYSVTSISNSAFYGKYIFNSITIPSSVTSIGDQAFSGCLNLTSISIPSSVISIGYQSFESCVSMTSVTLTNGITSIGIGAFMNCIVLPSIVSPSSVISIGDNAFQSCYSMTSVTLPTNGLTIISVSLFVNCSLLTSISIPSSVISIGSNAFKSCSSLSSIAIPSYVTSIGSGAFQDCSGLTSIILPTSGLTSIGTGAFQSCTGLTSIIIPSPVTSIGSSAFQDCTSLSSVILSTNNVLTSIGINAFQSCRSLNSIIIPSPVTSIGEGAFQYCTTLSSVIFLTNNVLNSIGISAFSGCIALTAINFTNITRPAGWSIGNSAFNCPNLKHVVFGSIIPTIGTTNNFINGSDIAYSPNAPAPITGFSANSTTIVSPLAPTITSVVSTFYGNAIVNFTPGNIPQPPITNYKYSLDGSNSNTWIPCSPAITTTTTTSTSFTISGLSSGTTYIVSMKATNFIGDGPASNVVVFTTTSSTTGPFSTIGTNSILGINNIPNLSINTNCLAFHAPMGVYFTNPNLYAPTSQYFNFNSSKGFNFNSGNTKLATIDNVGSLWSNGLYVTGGGVAGGGNIICESNIIVLGKVSCSKLQLSNSSNIVSIRRINYLVGSNGSGLKTGNGNVVSYGTGVTYTDITKLFFTITFFLNYPTQVGDTFSATIVSVTPTSMTFNVQRTDNNAAWGNANLCAHVIITEIA